MNNTIHNMNLYPLPFDAVRSRTKTVEMRLNDEKREKIRIGDLIRFTNVESGEELLVRVLDRRVFQSFEELYACYDKVSIGYKPDEEEDPGDMLLYYTKEKIKRYGALALVIEVI